MLGSGRLVKQAREAARLSREELARWARLDVALLASAEDDGVTLPADALDQCARVFGLRLEDLIAGEAGTAPMTLLLRSDDRDGLDLRSVLTTEIDMVLGEFQRVVRDVAEVERALDIVSQPLPKITKTTPVAGVHPGEHSARLVRAYLDLDDGPIPSMTGLVRSLGIVVIWMADDQQADKALDGACTRLPRPAILVNVLAEGKSHPWRARMTLAHELCHLLFDTLSPNRQVLASPTGSGLSLALSEMERHARAFAACFLVPERGVKTVVGQRDPSSEEAIRAVGETYGVGRTVAINRLQHVFALTERQRNEMTWRAATPYAADFRTDEVPSPIGLRGHTLQELLRRAVAERRIPVSRARRMLLLDGSVPLPFPELGELGAAVVSAEARIMRLANQYLAKNYPNLIAGEPKQVDSEWHLSVHVGGVGVQEPVPCGKLVMDERGTLHRYESL